MNMPLQGLGPYRRPGQTIVTYPRPHHRNAVLAALSPRAFSMLESQLRHRDFAEGSVLWDAGAPTERVFFPLSGVISVVLPVKDGSGIEVASVGREAVAGLSCGSGQFRSVTQGITLISGTFSYMSASALANAAKQNDEIARVMAICCETIAQALGIRRTTVTLIAQGLQMEGMISYRRGKIRIRNREGLRTAACDCCAALGRANWPSERFTKSAAETGDAQSGVC